eukprot:57345-Pyramimonas_sp.AAC.1
MATPRGSIDRDMPLQVMAGARSFEHDLKRRTPYKTGQTRLSGPPELQLDAGQLACEVARLQGNLHAGQPAFVQPACCCLICVFYCVGV